MERLAKFVYFSLLIGICYFIFPYFLPFILALIVVTMLEPIVSFFVNRMGIGRAYTVLISYTIFFFFIFSSMYFLLVKIISETVELLRKLPETIDKFSSQTNDWFQFYNSLSPSSKEYLKETSSTLTLKLNDILSTLAGNLFSIATQFTGYFVAFIVFMISVYIMGIEYPKLKTSFLRFFKEGDSRQSMEIVINKLKDAVIGFLQAQVILSTLTFVITAVALKIIGIEYVLFSALVVVIIDLLPILGTGAALIPWASYLFLAGEIHHAIGLIILFVIITIVRRALEPKLIGKSLGITPLITLISMYIGFSLVGIIGMIIGPAVIIVLSTLERAEILKFRFSFK